MELRRNGQLISSSGNDDQFLFLGLDPDSYIVKAVLNSGNSPEEKEKEVYLRADSVLDFSNKEAKTDESEYSPAEAKEKTSSASILGGGSIFDRSSKHLIGYLLIGTMNLAGLFFIMKIMKKD